MSYVEYDDVVRIKVPYSEALEEIVFTPSLNLIEVAYASNPDLYYEHYDCTSKDLKELTDLLEYHQSGYHGYENWKNSRRVDYKAKNRRKFEAFWRGLNDYEKVALVDWAGDKKWGSEWIELTRSIKSKKRQRS